MTEELLASRFLLTAGFTPPYHLHHRGATLLPTHGLPPQGLLCTVGVGLDPQECSTRRGDVWNREPDFFLSLEKSCGTGQVF